MRHRTLPNWLKRVLMTSMVLIFLSTFTVVVLGRAVKDMHREIQALSTFLVNAETVQPNFERSLAIYTDATKEVTDYVLSLRPENETEYITFISEVEGIGQDLSLNLDLNSVQQSVDDEGDSTGSNTLDYEVRFYGSMDNLKEFLREIEDIPYFVKVEEISYRNLSQLSEDEIGRENINLKIKLYVK